MELIKKLGEGHDDVVKMWKNSIEVILGGGEFHSNTPSSSSSSLLPSSDEDPEMETDSEDLDELSTGLFL